MADKYDNPNRTSEGIASATIVSTNTNFLPEMTGMTTADVINGEARFPSLRISCPGLQYRVRYTYRRFAGVGGIDGTSLPFNVGPSRPRLDSAHFDETGTSVLLKYDRETNRGDMPPFTDCSDVLEAVGVHQHNSTFQVIPVCGTYSQSTCPVSLTLGNLFPPVCSWVNARTLKIDLGAQAQLRPYDALFLRTNKTEGGVEVRSRIIINQQELLSYPLADSTPHPVLPNEALVQYPWTCEGWTLQTTCYASVPGTNIQSVKYFEYFDKRYLAVASMCTGTSTCRSYEHERGLVIYEVIDRTYRNGQVRNLVEYQAIPATGAMSIERFVLEFDQKDLPQYIAVAQFYDGDRYNLTVEIYGDDAGTWVPTQSVPTDGAVSVTAAAFAGKDYLLIGQRFAGSRVLRWAEGQFQINPISRRYEWVPGMFVDLFALPTSDAGSIFQFRVDNSWIVGVANQKSLSRCEAVTCPDDGRSHRTTTDLYRMGGYFTIKEFIPYPAPNDEDACDEEVPWVFQLSENYANISLESSLLDPTPYLTVGAYIQIDTEILRVVATAEADNIPVSYTHLRAHETEADL
eukprot:1645215-Rhodomonas_salina.1